MSLRALYRTLELPGAHPMKVAQSKLDEAVREAYGMSKTAPALAHLLSLNKAVAAREKASQPVTGPGLPSAAKYTYVTGDSLRMPPVE